MKKIEAIVKPFKLEEVKDALGEVGTVVRHEVEVRAVGIRVQLAEEGRILLGHRFYFKTIDCAVVGRANKLVPVPAGYFSLLCIRSDRLEVFAAILIAEE